VNPSSVARHESAPKHGDLQIPEHFLGFREVVIRSAGGGDFGREGDDHRESVPNSCRLGDATSGNTQQPRQLDRNPAVNRRVAGSNPA
jgi:hypothetical protein